MTATEPTAPAPAQAETPVWRRMLIVGTGFGIAIGARDLEAAAVRARPSGPVILGGVRVEDFRARPAAEWGAELTRFLERAGEKRLAATVLLPREETIVRLVHLPGVANSDIAGAMELQIDSLHPYGDEEIAWAFMPAGGAHYVIGLVRKAILDSYETLFSEAGIPVAAFSFSSAAIHAALRIWSAAPASLLAFTTLNSRTEVYGESEARPLYSAEFPTSAERALALSRGELRLPHDCPARPLAEVLPGAAALRNQSGIAEDVSPFAYAAALAGSAPMLTRFANLLPKERRASSARRQYLLPGVLGLLLALGAIGVFVVMPALEQRSYLSSLNAEIRRLEPRAQLARSLEKRATANRAKIEALDDIRRRPQADLEVLNELTRILPAQVWVNSIEIHPDSVILAGEADQAAPLLKLLDSSPLFQNSEFALSVTHNAQNEQFRIKTVRRGRAGRATP
jgi:Tfp pilus assembly protein PilN